MSEREERLELDAGDRITEGIVTRRAETPKAARSRGRLWPRDRARPDRRSGHAQMHLRGDASVALANSVVDARERQGCVPILASSRANVYLDPRHSWSQGRRMSAHERGELGVSLQAGGTRGERRVPRSTRYRADRSSGCRSSRGDRPGRTLLLLAERGNLAKWASRSHRRRHPPQCQRARHAQGRVLRIRQTRSPVTAAIGLRR